MIKWIRGWLRGGRVAPRLANEHNPYQARVDSATTFAMAVAVTAAHLRHESPLDLALCLVDRGDHAKALTDHLAALCSPDHPRAVLVIVPGYDLDCHWSLLLRCLTWDLKEKTGKEWVNCGAVNWPGSTISRVLLEVGGKLGIPDATQKSLQEFIGEQGPSISFHHNIDDADWTADNGKVVGEWIELFRNNGLAPHPGRFILAFLCLQLARPRPDDRSDHSRALQDALERWREELTDRCPSVLIMQQLHRVRRRHLSDWVSTLQMRLRLQVGYADFDEQIVEVFRMESEKHMLDVHTALKPPLKSLLEDDRPRVVRQL